MIVQAEHQFRDQVEDIPKLKVRNTAGTMVPLGSLATVREINGPLVLTRYNMYPAASVTGAGRPGVSSRDAIDLMESLRGPNCRRRWPLNGPRWRFWN